MLNTLYKDRLNEKERQAYDIVCREISLCRHPVQIPFQIDPTRVLHAVNYDHPEFFYINWLEKIPYVRYPGRTSIRLSMIYSEEEICGLRRKIEALAKSIAGISNYGKALGVHDWFIRNIDYDHGGLKEVIRSPGMFSAAGPLLRKKAVCAGISRLACLLLREKGVDCAVITGTALNGGPHAWNAFCADNGAVMYTDITFDIGNSRNRRRPAYRYFNLTAAEISKDHLFVPV